MSGRKFLGLGVVVAAAIAAFPAVSADSPENLIKYRQANMKAVGGHMASLAAIAKGDIAAVDHAAAHAEAIADIAKNAGYLFAQPTANDKFKDTKALPDIWSKQGEFNKAASDFAKASASMVDAAKTKDRAKIGEAMKALGGSCGGCHKPFRAS